MTMLHVALKSALIVALSCCIASNAQAQSKDAEAATRKANADMAAELPFSDSAAFDDAKRGLIATLADDTIPGANGQPAFSVKSYAFLDKDAPPATVIPVCGGKRG